MMLSMAATQQEYIKALNALQYALSLPRDDITRDASIQRFEFCVELAWKSARKLMGTASTTPKQVVREMARAGLIDDVELWLEAIDHRNLTSHTYNEELADRVYRFAMAFLPEGIVLRERLEKMS